MSSSDLTQIAEQICGEHGCNLLSLVGAGAFKQTFQIANPDGQAAALKVFGQQGARERNDREIAAIQQCHHDNIARLLSVGVIDVGISSYVFTMEEFIGGERLPKESRVLVLLCKKPMISARH